tara:strand:+ start:1915 stop:2349 length:435 start_codon:yes stop_codon:yes gene_type:complete
MSIRSWSKASFSYHHGASLTGNFQVFEVTQDLTNSPDSDFFPDTCNIQSIEFEFTAKSSASSVTAYIARDSAGDVPITPGTTSGASQSITVGATTATKGGAALIVDNDYTLDTGVSNSSRQKIYVVAKVDAGTPTANIRVNWRG